MRLMTDAQPAGDMPLCPECRNGKPANCVGYTLIEVETESGTDEREVPCSNTTGQPEPDRTEEAIVPTVADGLVRTDPGLDLTEVKEALDEAAMEQADAMGPAHQEQVDLGEPQSYPSIYSPEHPLHEDLLRLNGEKNQLAVEKAALASERESLAGRVQRTLPSATLNVMAVDEAERVVRVKAMGYADSTFRADDNIDVDQLLSRAEKILAFLKGETTDKEPS